MKHARESSYLHIHALGGELIPDSAQLLPSYRQVTRLVARLAELELIAS